MRPGLIAMPPLPLRRLALVALLLGLSSACGRESGIDIATRAAQAAPDATAALSAQVIASDDLPPEGTRSLFDHLVAQNDGLPYPFEKLVELIERQDPQGEKVVAVMLPLGRSLLKAQADFQHPRVLVAADYQAPNTEANLGLAPRGQLFLGFVENAAEIEVLSYNEAAGRYEFQLVQDYSEHGQRRIVYARRAVCLTCHQGGTPIFPQRPWNETNGQPELAAQIVAARGNDAPYLGVPARQPLAAPERFDELTDLGGFLVTTQRLWIDACGGGLAAPAAAPDAASACRRLMLKLALRYAIDPGEFDAASPDAQRLRELQAVSWPAAGIAVPESDIRNRDPLQERRGLRGWWHARFAAAPEPGAGAKTNEDLAAFDKLPKLPVELDPLSPRSPKRVIRAQDLDGVYGVASLFSADDLRLLEARHGYSRARLEAAVDALPETVFAAAPVGRVRLMQALLAGNAGAAVPGYCCLATNEMSLPTVISVPPLTLTANSPLHAFAEYCFACHRGNPAQRLDFMSGADEAAVTAQIRATSKIRDALDWSRYRGTDKEATMMPPADSPQRVKMEADLAQQPQLLEQMRAQVPGLFDF